MFSQNEKNARTKAHLLQSAETKQRVAEQCIEPIVRAAELIAGSFKAGGKLLLCGNGGSAADCQHIAAEFVGTLTQDFKRPGLKAIALTTDTSFLTAYSNDFGYEGVFARQVETLGAPGDTLIGISTSGNSPNVLLAVEAARKIDIRTIGLAGERGPVARTSRHRDRRSQSKHPAYPRSAHYHRPYPLRFGRTLPF